MQARDGHGARHLPCHWKRWTDRDTDRILLHPWVAQFGALVRLSDVKSENKVGGGGRGEDPEPGETQIARLLTEKAWCGQLCTHESGNRSWRVGGHEREREIVEREKGGWGQSGGKSFQYLLVIDCYGIIIKPHQQGRTKSHTQRGTHFMGHGSIEGYQRGNKGGSSTCSRVEK